jgi:hypothetical protein
VDGDEGLFIKTFVTDDDGMGMKLPYKEPGPRHLGPTANGTVSPTQFPPKESKPSRFLFLLPSPPVGGPRSRTDSRSTRRQANPPHRHRVWAARPASGSGDVIGKRPYNLRAAGPGQR